MTEPVSYSHLFPDIAEREELAGLIETRKAAKIAISEHHLDPLTSFDGDIQRCAASGIPIMADDEYVEDPATGEMWLRAVVGLGPRDVEDDDETADESEMETETV